MADVLVKPAFQSAYADSGDATKFGPNAWNANRLFSGGVDGEVIVRSAASATGAAWSAGPELASLRLTAPTGVRFLELTSPDEAVNFAFLYNRAAFASGGLGNEAYDDDVVSWGFNQGTTTQVPGVAGKASTYYTIEHKFFAGGKYGSEAHLEHVDTGGVAHRASSYWFPHDGGTGSGFVQGVDYVNWTNWAGDQRIQWHLLNKNGDLSDSFKLRFGVNNVPIVQQVNATGSYLNLPYINSADTLAITQALAVNATVPASTVFSDWYVSGLANNSFIHRVDGNAVTGTVYVSSIGINATAGLIDRLLNNAAGANAHTAFKLYTASTGGDPKASFEIDGGTAWVIGADNSASDRFVIANDTVLGGAGDRFVMETNGDLTLSGSVTLADAKNIIVNATTGTKIGTATTQKIGFFNATPVVQRTTFGANDGSLGSVATQANLIRTALRDLGLVA